MLGKELSAFSLRLKFRYASFAVTVKVETITVRLALGYLKVENTALRSLLDQSRNVELHVKLARLLFREPILLSPSTNTV